MLVKVCGFKDDKNLSSIIQLDIDMIGLNFYPKSKRYLDDDGQLATLIPEQIERVGVFVNENFDRVVELAKLHQLHYVQLHGDESPAYCARMKTHVNVIKAFGVSPHDNLDDLTASYDTCEFLLFDTHTIHRGGSGRKFDWKVLESYSGSIPFLLAGGLEPDDYKEIKRIDHDRLIGVDINSKFETSPGVKDVEKLNYFIENIR